MQINFSTNSPYKNDLQEVVRAFYPHIEADIQGQSVVLESTFSDNRLSLNFSGDAFSAYSLDFEIDAQTPIERKRLAKRHTKASLYRLFSRLTEVSLPYGSLTGVRPTKLFYELQKKGDAAALLMSEFDVSRDKAMLIKSVCDQQKGLLNTDEKSVDLYVNIPFCPTRCAYCSFVSVSMKQLSKYVNSYIKCLKQELSILLNAIKENSFKVRSVYVGGGTPTSFDAEQLTYLLSSIKALDVSEFTVEAGRPDTVTKEKLDALAGLGVTRISVNPQTFNDKTLRLIGRGHTADDTLFAYKLARNYDFDINMDLIAALPQESLNDFKFSLENALSLNPENITVHTLALKRGSKLTVENFDNTQKAPAAAQMVELARSELMSASYMPYYMYRQKYMSGNLENCGYCKQDKACVYNIDNMEECASVLAAGAGAISKKLYIDENRIERLANFKDVKGYIENFESIADKVKSFWL